MSEINALQLCKQNAVILFIWMGSCVLDFTALMENFISKWKIMTGNKTIKKYVHLVTWILFYWFTWGFNCLVKYMTLVLNTHYHQSCFHFFFSIFNVRDPLWSVSCQANRISGGHVNIQIFFAPLDPMSEWKYSVIIMFEKKICVFTCPTDY